MKLFCQILIKFLYQNICMTYMQTPDLELYALQYAQAQTEQERAIIFAEINYLIEQDLNSGDKTEWQSKMHEITQLMQKGVNNLAELTDKILLRTK
jgi:hypothetical protein